MWRVRMRVYSVCLFGQSVGQSVGWLVVGRLVGWLVRRREDEEG